MREQESEGLFSPIIRSIRLSRVAANVKAGSVVLDLACGAGYLGAYLPRSCRYYGVDRNLSSSAATDPSRFLQLDLMEKDAVTDIREFLPEKPDHIVCVAFLEHIERPLDFLRRFRTLLKTDGTFIGTTPHPRGRRLHDTLAKYRLLSREASLEHKTFLGQSTIDQIALNSGGRLLVYEQFLAGLNQLFVIGYPR